MTYYGIWTNVSIKQIIILTYWKIFDYDIEVHKANGDPGDQCDYGNYNYKRNKISADFISQLLDGCLKNRSDFMIICEVIMTSDIITVSFPIH